MNKDICHKCGTLLTEKNWLHCHKKDRRYICKPCHKLQREKYKEKVKISGKKHYKKNKIRILKEKKTYYEKNKEKILESKKSYYDKNKIEINKKYGRWRKTDRGKISSTKKRHKWRELGFTPLNEPFEGSEGHHINHDDVIYIPYEWNHIIYHNVRTGKNMEIVNTYAYFFLVQQNIKESNKLFKYD